MSGLRLEGHLVIFLAIQTHRACRFLLAIDCLSLRRSGTSSQIINQPQDYFEQASRNRHFGQLEGGCDGVSMNGCHVRNGSTPVVITYRDPRQLSGLKRPLNALLIRDYTHSMRVRIDKVSAGFLTRIGNGRFRQRPIAT